MSSIHGDIPITRLYKDYLPCPMIGITDHSTLGPFGLMPELMLTRKGAQGKLYTTKYLHSLWYLDAPLLVSYSFIPSLSLIAGPSVGYYLTGTLKQGPYTMDENSVPKINLGCVIGMQLNLPITDLGVDVRYQRGFTNTMYRLAALNAMTDNISFTATYMF